MVHERIPVSSNPARKARISEESRDRLNIFPISYAGKVTPLIDQDILRVEVGQREDECLTGQETLSRTRKARNHHS
jgi:hypothetical protein